MATSRVGHADRTFGGGGAEAAAISSSTSSPVKACATTPSRGSYSELGGIARVRRAQAPPNERAAEPAQGGQRPLPTRGGELIAEQVEGSYKYLDITDFRHHGIPGAGPRFSSTRREFPGCPHHSMSGIPRVDAL